MLQSIGKRIAQLRNENGWTQQYLAERLAISRVAVSHIEMDLSIPGERTITLLAGLFKQTPLTLVENTTYPQAKKDRLPFVVCCYTSLEHDLSLLRRDIWWLAQVDDFSCYHPLKEQIQQQWTNKLATWKMDALDPEEQKRVKEAYDLLQQSQTSSSGLSPIDQ